MEALVPVRILWNGGQVKLNIKIEPTNYISDIVDYIKKKVQNIRNGISIKTNGKILSHTLTVSDVLETHFKGLTVHYLILEAEELNLNEAVAEIATLFKEIPMDLVPMTEQDSLKRLPVKKRTTPTTILPSAPSPVSPPTTASNSPIGSLSAPLTSSEIILCQTTASCSSQKRQRRSLPNPTATALSSGLISASSSADTETTRLLSKLIEIEEARNLQQSNFFTQILSSLQEIKTHLSLLSVNSSTKSSTTCSVCGIPLTLSPRCLKILDNLKLKSNDTTPILLRCELTERQKCDLSASMTSTTFNGIEFGVNFLDVIIKHMFNSNFLKASDLSTISEISEFLESIDAIWLLGDLRLSAFINKHSKFFILDGNHIIRK
jgi:hypothetical protein